MKTLEIGKKYDFSKRRPRPGAALSALRKTKPGHCRICKRPFLGIKTKKFCSNACRLKNFRINKKKSAGSSSN